MSKGNIRVIKREKLRFAGEPERVPAGPPPEARMSENSPHVDGEMQVMPEREEDGIVRSIRVQCPCGQETVIQCIFEGEDDGEKDSD